MRIKHVHVTNLTPPGKQFWDAVASQPDEPLIEATMFIVLSHNEYHELLDRDKQSSDDTTEMNFRKSLGWWNGFMEKMSEVSRVQKLYP